MVKKEDIEYLNNLIEDKQIVYNSLKIFEGDLSDVKKDIETLERIKSVVEYGAINGATE